MMMMIDMMVYRTGRYLDMMISFLVVDAFLYRHLFIFVKIYVRYSLCWCLLVCWLVCCGEMICMLENPAEGQLLGIHDFSSF